MELVNPQEAFFPESDGAPMGETSAHIDIMCDCIPTLKRRFAGRQVLVGGNQFLYYDRTDPRKVLCPDVYVTFGVDPGPRRTYKVWEEGLAPHVIIEFLSRSTASNDLGPKRLVYESLGVAEYFTYDLLDETAPPKLRGWRRVGNRFVDIAPEDGPGETLRSEVLGLFLRAEGEALRLVDAESGEKILFAEEARREAETRRQVAEAGRQEAETGRRDADAARRLAEKETARLKVELERLRRER